MIYAKLYCIIQGLVTDNACLTNSVAKQVMVSEECKDTVQSAFWILTTIIARMVFYHSEQDDQKLLSNNLYLIISYDEQTAKIRPITCSIVKLNI